MAVVLSGVWDLHFRQGDVPFNAVSHHHFTSPVPVVETRGCVISSRWTPACLPDLDIYHVCNILLGAGLSDLRRLRFLHDVLCSNARLLLLTNCNLCVSISFRHGDFSVAPAEILDSNMVLYLSTISLLISHWHWVHTRNAWSTKDVGSPNSTSLLSTFHIGLMFCLFPANFMSSTCTDKNNPFLPCTNKHSQLETFSQPYFYRIFSICLLHNSPAKGWPYRFRSRGTIGSSILDHDFGHLCRGRRIQMSAHSDFGISNNFGASSIYLRKGRYCVSCLSCAFWQSEYDIHDLCCCHLWCWWSLFGEYCARPWVVFYNITSEYNPTFVFLVLCLQLSSFQMTYAHQWGEMNFFALRPCFIDHLFFYFWLLLCPTPESFQASPMLYPLLLLLPASSWLEA